MTDLGLTHALTTNANVENEHASAAAGATSDGALHASDAGDVSHGGSAAADGSYDVHAPEAPELPVDVPVDVPVDAPVDVPEIDGAQGALSGAADVAATGESASVEGTFDGWLDAMGDVMADIAAQLSAALGL